MNKEFIATLDRLIKKYAAFADALRRVTDEYRKMREQAKELKHPH